MLWRRSFLLVGAVWLAACGVTPTATVTPPLATAIAHVPTASPRPATATRQPSATPSLAPSNTPTATPTLTPSATTTFDPQATVATVTPAPAEVCVPTNPNAGLTPDFLSPSDRYFRFLEQDIYVQQALDYLNTAGPEGILAELAAQGQQAGVDYAYLDLTNDGTPEVVLRLAALTVVGCMGGRYQLLWQGQPAYLNPWILAADDLNHDNTRELVVVDLSCGLGACFYVSVWGWDGASFQNLAEPPYFGISVGGSDGPPARVDDVDGDGYSEIVLVGGIPSNFDYDYFGPWRVRTDVYGWNGALFAARKSYYSAPEYRFQALQDADRAVNAGNYITAQAGYDAVIHDTTLDWWSPAKKENWVAANQSTHSTDPSPTPLPGDGGLEYAQLSAYAYFRLTLLHLLQGQTAEAEVAFTTLQTEYPAGNAGHPSAEMAQAFWQAYAADQTVAAGCSAAVGYATEHPDLLTPLGSDYHGWQSYTYTPEMVCPLP